MANTDERSRPATSSVINTNLPNVVVDSNKNSLPIRATRCATGSDFIKTIHGILNVVVMVKKTKTFEPKKKRIHDESLLFFVQVALICVLISAGVAGRDQSKAADYSPVLTRARVSAFHTRNAVLVFASFGLFLIFLDTLLHVTKLINSFSAKFEFLVSEKSAAIRTM